MSEIKIKNITNEFSEEDLKNYRHNYTLLIESLFELVKKTFDKVYYISTTEEEWQEVITQFLNNNSFYLETFMLLVDLHENTNINMLAEEFLNHFVKTIQKSSAIELIIKKIYKMKYDEAAKNLFLNSLTEHLKDLSNFIYEIINNNIVKRSKTMITSEGKENYAEEIKENEEIMSEMIVEQGDFEILDEKEFKQVFNKVFSAWGISIIANLLYVLTQFFELLGDNNYEQYKNIISFVKNSQLFNSSKIKKCVMILILHEVVDLHQFLECFMTIEGFEEEFEKMVNQKINFEELSDLIRDFNQYIKERKMLLQKLGANIINCKDLLLKNNVIKPK